MHELQLQRLSHPIDEMLSRPVENKALQVVHGATIFHATNCEATQFYRECTLSCC
jgi:hypothetical protein